jgi:hypothetical protein
MLIRRPRDNREEMAGCRANTIFHLLLNLNKWKIITDRTVTHGTVTQNLERSHWGLSLAQW